MERVWVERKSQSRQCLAELVGRIWKVCERNSVNRPRWEGAQQGCVSLVCPLQGSCLAGVSSLLVLGFPFVSNMEALLEKLPQLKFGCTCRSLSYKASFGLTGLICSEVLNIYCPFLFTLILIHPLLSICILKQGTESPDVSRVEFELVG